MSAWGTGKTMFGLLRGMNASLEHQNNLGLIVRNEFTDLRDSTIKDFERYFNISVPSSKDVELPNKSTIMFRHGAELEVLQNINLGWFLIEQAEEFETDEQFQMLRGRLRRDGVPHWGGLIANTKGHNWIWRLWKQINSQRDADYDLIEATTFDNSVNLPADFIEDLKRMQKESPSHYNRFVLNSWEDLDVDDRVIPYSTILAAVNRFMPCLTDRFIIGCDPAEFGDDETAIYVLNYGKVIDSKFYCKKEPMETAGWLAKLSREHHRCPISIDNVGVGSAIASRLRELGITTYSADARRSSGQKQRFQNLKSEMFWTAREMFVEQLVSIPDDSILIEELGAISYDLTSSGEIKLVDIDSKDKIRKRLGRSPNRCEALVYALWGSQFIPDNDGKDTDHFSHECDLARSYV